MFRGKKYQDSAKLVDKTKQYDVGEALDLAVKTAKAKFDETVEVHVRLGVDSRHADQQVRGAIVLPHGTGKTARVLVSRFVFLYSLRVQRLMKLLRQALTMSEKWILFQKSRVKTGLILT